MATRGEVRYRLVLDNEDFKKHAEESDSIWGKFKEGMAEGVGIETLHLLTEGAMKVGEALLGMSEHLIAYGEQIGNMSIKTGIAAESLQALEHAGKMSGISLDQISGAVSKMQKNLVEGSTAFERLHIDVSKFKDLAPEKQFEEVAAAIQKIGDPAQRAAAAMEVFGKTGAEMLPLLMDDVSAMNKEWEDLGVTMSGETIAAAKRLEDQTNMLGEAWTGLKNRLVEVIVTSPDVLDALKGITEFVADIAKVVHENQDGIRLFLSLGVSAAKELGSELKHISELMGSVVKFASQTRIWGAFFPNAEDIKFLSDAAAGLAKLQGIHAAIMAGGEAGGKVGGSFISQKDVDDTKKRAEELAKILQSSAETDLASTIKTLAQKTNEHEKAQDYWLKTTIKEAADEVEARQKAGEQWLKDENRFGASLLASWKARQEEIAARNAAIYDAIMRGADAIDDVKSALEAFGMSSDSIFGKILGNASNLAKAAGGIFKAFTEGDIIDKISAIAKGVGALGSAIGGLFKNKEVEKVNDLRDAFFAAHGGFADFAKELSVYAQDSLVQKIFDAKTVDQFNAATKEAMDILQTGADATKALDEVAKRYNLTIEEMGPAMQKQELDKQALQLIEDWKLLTASGVDVSVVETKMGANMSDFVNTSLKAGQAIPEAMKPMLEKMADAGTLLDANGDAYTRAEVDGLSYTQTMSEMFETMIQKIDRMVSALLGIPANVSTTITTNHQDTYPDNRAGNQDPNNLALGGIINAAGGVVVPHRPRVGTLVRMGEGGSAEVAVPVKVLFGKFGDDIASKVAGRSDEAVRSEIAGLRADLAGLDKLLARSVTSAILKGIA